MKDAMIKFGKDIVDLTKHNAHFMVDHWVGLAVTTAAFYTIVAGVLYIDYRKLDSEIERERKAIDEAYGIN